MTLGGGDVLCMHDAGIYKWDNSCFAPINLI